ncbi:MAG: hypothetical protein LDLANPLL_00482 [Turneriella sp.]|nr:hypothetical protein [Turneriella sp.]
MALKNRALRYVASLIVVLAVIAYWVLRPIRNTDFSLGEFTVLRDDVLAAKYAPRILPHATYGAPTRLFYRMGKNSENRVFIAYHPFFEDEINPHSGFGATINRLVYTGGLRLKDFIFGAADIELIEVILDKNLYPKKIAWEGAENYQPKNFGVKHKPEAKDNPTVPFCFAITTWNHMFKNMDSSACSNTQPLKVEYFSTPLWEKYSMTKETEAILRRNRAHRIYERVAVKNE